MSRREHLIAEMGLGPVWRLRQAPAQAAAAEQPPAGVSPISSVQVEAPVESSAVAALDGDERAARIARMNWTELKAAISGCEACGLCRTRKNAVVGVGDESADWMIVGEAPGAEEDERGEPFVGQAGRLLDSMLAAVDLKRGSNVYIANVLKCRPPGNRNPEPAEVARCAPFLTRQIELVQPKIILAFGRFAAQTLLNTDASIGSLRGREFRYQGVSTVVSYHPAYLLRNLPDKSKAWEDLCFARELVGPAAA